jgi:hypothetical protein
MNRIGTAARLLGCAAFCLAAQPAAAGFQPSPKDVCVVSTGGQRVDIDRLAAKLLDANQITSWQLDTTGSISTQTQINAVHLHDFCKNTGHCDSGVVKKLIVARVELEQFLKSIPGKDDENSEKHDFEISVKPGESQSLDLVSDFLEGRTVITCTAPIGGSVPPTRDAGGNLTQTPAASAPNPDTAAAPPQAEPQSQSPVSAVGTAGGDWLPSLAQFVVRAKVDDLAYGTDSPNYKGLSSATLGFDANAVSHADTYTASGVVGYQVNRIYYGDPGDWTDIVPYVGYNLKKVETNPHPKSGNIDTMTAGLLFDTLFRAGFYQEIKAYPQFMKSYQDGSETLSGTLTYIPEPAIPILAAPYDIGDLVYVMAQPSFNLGYQQIMTAGENKALLGVGDYTRYGPGLDFYVYGFPGSVLEKFSAAASYRYFFNDGLSLHQFGNLQSSISYTPFGQQNVSITFKYVVGRDLAALVSEKEYTLGIGIKF